MSLELLLIGLAVLVVAALLTPLGRDLTRTLVDIVDGSLGLYAIRGALGLDTSTRRQRRIARRRAAEQAELERRIGTVAMASSAPTPTPPTRLVASGETVRHEDAPSGPRPRAPRSRPLVVGRRQHLQDVAAALAVIVVVIAGANLLSTRTGGVLGTTGRPATERPATAAPTPTETPTMSATPTPTAAPPEGLAPAPAP